MKNIVYYLLLTLFICLSCDRKSTYLTESVNHRIRIDGVKNEQIKLNYIGNSNYNKLFYEPNLKIPSINNSLVEFGRLNIKADNRFKKDEPIYKIENTTNQILYVLVLLNYGDDEKNKPHIYDMPHFPQHYTEVLLKTYEKEDEDSNFVTGDSIKTHKGSVKYISRIEFYENLIEHKFPYIHKLKPMEKCIVRWGLTK